MIREALEHLAAQALDAHGISVLKDAPADCRRLYLNKGGGLVVHELPAPPRSHRVHDLSSYAEACGRFQTEEASTWVALNQVVCLLNDGIDSHRIDRVTLPLNPHHAFSLLRERSNRWMEQEEFVDLLRHELTDANIDPPSLLQAVRNLKFATQSEVTGEFTKTSAAMGRSISSQVTGEVDLPETVSVEFHPFPALADVLDSSVIVFCTLFTDPAGGKLKLASQPGQLEAAEVKAKSDLAGTLRVDLSHNVFVGTP